MYCTTSSCTSCQFVPAVAATVHCSRRIQGRVLPIPQQCLLLPPSVTLHKYHKVGHMFHHTTKDGPTRRGRDCFTMDRTIRVGPSRLRVGPVHAPVDLKAKMDNKVLLLLLLLHVVGVVLLLLDNLRKLLDLWLPLHRNCPCLLEETRRLEFGCLEAFLIPILSITIAAPEG